MNQKNPFLTAGYEGEETFCDRARETQKLVGALENGRNVTLIAPRRYGKTGLIHHVFHHLADSHDCVYIDIYATTDLCQFIQLFARSVMRELETTSERILSVTTSFFKSFRPTMTTNADGSLKWSFDVTASTAETSLHEIFTYLKSRERPVVIAFDEFQQVRKYPERGTEALLRSYIQFLPNVRFLFAGSQHHMMADMFVSPQGPFYNSTDIMSLPVIDRSAYRTFAKRFFADQGLAFADDVFDRMYAMFDGVTWYVQSVLNRVWQFGTGLGGDDVVAAAVSDLLEDRSLVFHDLFFSQADAPKALLMAIASEGLVKTPTGSEFIAKYGLGAASTIASALDSLIGKELVYRTPQGVFVYDRLFAEWIRTSMMKVEG